MAKRRFVTLLLFLSILALFTVGLRASDQRIFGQYTDETVGDLEARVRSDSPLSCGIEMIEVGREVGSTFTPQFAFLKDKYDETYPGFEPKIRYLYSYGMPPQFFNDEKGYFIPGPPKKILNVEAVKAKFVAKGAYRVLVAVVNTLGSIPKAVTYVVSQIMDTIDHYHVYHRSKTLYSLRLMRETENPSLMNLADLVEVARVLAVGGVYSYTSLLISPHYRAFVADILDGERNRARVEDSRHLLWALDRMCVLAQPVFKDFIIARLDPNDAQCDPDAKGEYADLRLPKRTQPTELLARKLEIFDRYIDDLPRDKDGLILLGVFHVGTKNDRKKIYDDIYPHQVQARELLRRFKDMGVEFVGTFLPFPISMAVRITEKGVIFFGDKRGRNPLIDVLAEQGEWAACLESGICKWSEGEEEKLRIAINKHKTNPFLINDAEGGDERLNYVKNQEHMGYYLKNSGEALCKQVKAVREWEYQKTYLNTWEKVKRTFWDRMMKRSKTLKETRRQDIAQKKPYEDARDILENYDPTRASAPTEKVIEALDIVSKAQRGRDSGLIARRITHTGDIEIVAAAFRAAGVNGDADLATPVIEFLEEIDIQHAALSRLPIKEALEALSRLKIEKSMSPQVLFSRIIQQLEKFISSEDSEIAKQAKSLINQMQNRLTEAQNEEKVFIQSNGLAQPQPTVEAP